MILLRVTIFFLLLLLLPDWFIYKTYLKPLGRKSWNRLWWTPTVLLLVALAAFLIGGEALHSYLGVYLVTVICISVPKAFFALLAWPVRLLRKRFTSSPIEIPGLCIPSLLLFGYLLFGAIKGKEHFQVREVTFSSPDLPEAFDGYRVLQISDLHVGSWKGNATAMQRAIDLCNAQQADLAVFTGDLVNSRASEMEEFIPVLSQLHAKDGVYSVLGNHDYATYVKWNSEAERLANIDTLIARQNGMGWQMLMNEHVNLYRGNDSIALVGVENSGNPPFPNKGDLPKAMKGTEGMFKVLLSHDPTHWRREVLPKTDIQLMLAGHTHDMQFRIFGFSASRFFYPEHNGLYREGNRGLYVNIGLGYVLFPMRLGAWPEITVLTLRKE